MKAKLSALTLALIPVLANASIELSSAQSPSYKSDSIIVVYKDTASKLDRRNARSIVQARISDLNNDEIDEKNKQSAINYVSQLDSIINKLK